MIVNYLHNITVWLFFDYMQGLIRSTIIALLPLESLDVHGAGNLIPVGEKLSRERFSVNSRLVKENLVAVGRHSHNRSAVLLRVAPNSSHGHQVAPRIQHFSVPSKTGMFQTGEADSGVEEGLN